MKYINYLLSLVIFLSACQVSTLTDATGNEFTAVATQGDHTDKIVISWIQRDFYANYTVLKSTAKDGFYLPIKEFFNGGEVEDRDIVEGRQYFYKVRGYNKLGTSMFVTEPANGFGGASGGFLPPDEITSNPGSSTKEIRFDWKRVPGAVEYEILKSIDNDFFDPIAKTALLHYIDKDVERGKTYYYKITSLDKDGIPSPDRSQSFIGELFGANLELRSPVAAYADKIQLIWKPYQYANKYSIYRSENPNEMGKMIKEIIISDERAQAGENLEYSDTDVQIGKLYYYTIIYQNQSTLHTTYTIRSYLKTESAPTQPQNLIVSQGSHPRDVSLWWDAVEGATSYEIARAVSKNGPWRILKTTIGTTYEDKNIPDDSYIYFYTVTGVDSVPGQVSVAKEGWANKAPINIIASKDFGAKVQLSWDKVPRAISYIVTFSETEMGSYKSAGSISAGTTKKVVFDHLYDIGNELVKDLWYKVEVNTTDSRSDPSPAIQGTIKKITAPKNVRVLDNKTPTKSMMIAWDAVPGARGYRVYQATLAHKNAKVAKLETSHFIDLGKSENAAFNLSFSEGSDALSPLYPIRRHVYLVRAIDAGGAEGVATKTDLVWRLPVDAIDFAKDVDFTIVQAQTQVPNFGLNPSKAIIQARASGNYDYTTGNSTGGGARNIWNNYTSFEVNLNGAQTVSVEISTLSAKLHGTLNVSGLYSGEIFYDNLDAKVGGYVFAGKMIIKYNGKSVTWNHTEAATHLDSVVLLGSENPPRRPRYEAGHGD